MKKNNPFFTDKDFAYLKSVTRTFMADIISDTLTLYRMDMERTKYDDLYNEARPEDKVFMKVATLPCYASIEEPEKKTLMDSFGRYEVLTLTFGIMEEDMPSQGILMGDFIGYDTPGGRMYFEVTDPNNTNLHTSVTMNYGKTMSMNKALLVNDDVVSRALSAL